MTFMYIANILVAGWISISSLFFPSKAIQSIFEGIYEKHDLVRLVGSLWFSIALISILGLFNKMAFAPIFLVQLIYKATWLITVALPAWKNKLPYPKGMTAFFILWVIILPFIIPWHVWF